MSTKPTRTLIQQLGMSDRHVCWQGIEAGKLAVCSRRTIVVERHPFPWNYEPAVQADFQSNGRVNRWRDFTTEISVLSVDFLTRSVNCLRRMASLPLYAETVKMTCFATRC